MFKKSIYQISEFKEKRFVFNKKGPEVDMSEAEKGALRDAAKTVTEADKTVDKMESEHLLDAETAAQLKLLARSVTLSDDYLPTDEDTRIAMETASKLGPELEKNPDMKLVIEKTLEMAREAADRMEAAKEEVKAGTDEELAKTASTVERSKIRMTLPEKAVLEKSKLAEMAEGEQKKLIGGYERLKVTIGTEAQKIHVEAHQTNSDSGLQKIYDDWNGMGIPVNTPFYQTVFYTLKEGIDPSKNERLRDPEKKAWYMDPAQHLDKIAGEDPEFAEAYKHYLFVEGFVRAQLDGHLGTLEEQRKIGKEPISEKLVDFARSNITEIQKAVKNRDYATMAVYGAGAYAIYKCYQEWFGGDKGGTIKKALMIGGALYAGNIFMQNAGYDVMKMMGLKDQNEELEGTPLASLFNLNMKETEGLDAKVVLRMSEVNVKDLYGEFQKVPKDGYGFIDPNQFPSIFPEFRGVPSFNLGMGEKGLNDYIGNADNKMSGRRREYVKMGNQLYILALSMRSAYEKTIQAESGVPFEKALEDPTIGKGKVRNFLEVIEAHAPSSLDAPKDLDKVEGALKGAFEGDVGFSLDRFAEKAGHYQGTLLSYPVVYVYDSSSKSYRVYLKPNYGGKDKPGMDFMATIPADPASPTAKLEGAKALAKVKAKVEELVKKNGKNDYAVKLEDGKWYAEMTAESKEFDIDSVTSKREVTISPDGNNINFPEEVDMLKEAILEDILNQESTRELATFANTKSLKVESIDASKKLVVLELGLARTKVTLEYKGGSFNIEDTTFLDDSLFARDYVDALEKDKSFKFNTVSKQIEDALEKSTPEDFVSHLFRSLGQMDGDHALKGVSADALTGSVPENFTKVILESSKRSALNRLRAKVGENSSLTELEAARKNVLLDVEAKMSSVLDTLNSHTEDWERDEFMMRVVEPLRQSGSISKEYSEARARAESMIYSLDLPGFLSKKSDLSEKSHLSAKKLLDVYTYYTAHLDDVSLDKVSYHRVSDTDIEGAKKIRYFEYVKDTIKSKASGMDSLSSIPDPSSSQWGLQNFDEWSSKNPDAKPLNDIDNRPPLEHNPEDEHAKGELTELETLYYNEFNVMIDGILAKASRFNKTINVAAIRSFQDDIIHGNAKKGIDPEFFANCNNISKTSGDRRSRQVREIERFLDLHRKELMDHDEYWLEISLKDRWDLLFD